MTLEIDEIKVDKQFSSDSYPKTGVFLVNNDIIFTNKETKETIYLGQKEMF